jgi:hypothetical protein
MIYVVTYIEHNGPQSHQRKKKRLIMVESEMPDLNRITGLINLLTNGNFNASSVEIAGEKNCEAARVKHPAIRLYRLE